MRSEPLAPGRGTDARVAEECLGWKWRVSRCTGRRCLFPAEGPWPEWFTKAATGQEPLVFDWATCTIVPRFSSSREAAMRLWNMDKYRNRLRVRCADLIVTEEWVVEDLERDLGERGFWEARAPTFELAVCAAVLGIATMEQEARRTA